MLALKLTSLHFVNKDHFIALEKMSSLYCYVTSLFYVCLSISVMKLFMVSMRIKSPAVLEYVSLPCLRILQHVIKPEAAGSKKNKVNFQGTVDIFALISPQSVFPGFF